MNIYRFPQANGRRRRSFTGCLNSLSDERRLTDYEFSAADEWIWIDGTQTVGDWFTLTTNAPPANIDEGASKIGLRGRKPEEREWALFIPAGLGAAQSLAEAVVQRARFKAPYGCRIRLQHLSKACNCCFISS